MAGIARENVSRVLRDWTSHSLVSRISGYYCLEDKAVFKRATEDYLVTRRRGTPSRSKIMRRRHVAAKARRKRR
jgi:hypothetical protein